MKRFTRDQALRETRALLGEQGAVKVITCSLGTGPGGVRRCSAIGIHDADCRGGAAAYVVGIKYEIGPVHLRTISHRGEGSTWEIALADAALHTHRLGCAACKSATKMADLCEHGRPLLDAFTRARTARFRLPNGRLSAAGLKAEAATRPGCVRLAYARSTGLLVGLYRAHEAGIESDEETPWATVCEEHGGVVCHTTRKLAEGWMVEPETWCPVCQEARGGPKAYPDGPAPGGGAQKTKDEE